MSWTRRSLLGAAGTLSTSAGRAEIYDVERGCVSVAPFSMSDVNAALPEPTTGPRPQVAAWYYQSWYHDPARMRALHLPPDFTEWDRVAQAKPVVPCEIQPKEPAWGPFDASDPRMAEREIAAAVDAGINVFVYTWMHGGGRSAQMAPLDHGFLHAANRNSLQFALTWINHDDPETRLDYDTMDWGELADAMLPYLAQPNYWRINGKPVFGIYRYEHLLNHYGVDGLRRHIADLRSRTGPLYLVCCVDYKNPQDPGQSGFDASTMYNAFSFTPFGRNPRNTVWSFRDAAIQTIKVWNDYARPQSVPFFPACPVGWDNSARIGRNARMIVHRSADQYEALIMAAKRFVWRARSDPAIVFLSCWNEWAEDHYLLPDRAYGDSYLKAVKRATK